MAGVFLAFFTLFWTGMVLAFDGFMGHGLYKQFESRHFLTTTGTVTHSELAISHGSKGSTSYSAKLEYKYDVGGQVFTGDKTRLGMSASSSYASALNMVNAHPAGSEVQVYYNPAAAYESLLEPGLKGTDLMGFIFMTPFNMVMLGLWIGIGVWLREHWLKPLAGGVKIIEDGMTTRVRLPRFPAVGWGIVTTGGLGFISIFIVGISTNMEPSMAVAMAVLAAIYVAGFGVFLWQRQKINSGIDDLILNESSRTIELPLTFDRKERMTVNLADIRSLSVEEIVHHNSKGGTSYTYAPTLCLGGAAPSVQRLADWSDKMKADAFSDWLRQKLGAGLPATLASGVVAAEDEEKESAAAAAREREFEEMRREGKSQIKVSDGPEGREFYFPAARNIGTAIFMTVFFAFWSGMVGLMIRLHAPVLFPVVFGIVDLIMFWGLLQTWFKSVRVTVNSTNVRVKKSWLIFGSTREFSAGDYVRFATKMGMQSGSKIYTDIRLVRAGADAEFSQGLKRIQNVQGVDQLVAARFRQAAGPSGVTVASSIANSAEAEWLVKEMNAALGQGQLHPGRSPDEMADGLIVSGPPKTKTKLASALALVFFVIVAGFGYQTWRHATSVPTKPAPAPGRVETASAVPRPVQPPPVLDVAFSSCGSDNGYEADGYLVDPEGYANSFVSKVSGQLKTVELKIEPANRSAEKLLVFIKEDQGGFPERTLETFSIPNPPSTNSAGWIVINSHLQPALVAGAKYWLCARSQGAWVWHFSPQNLIQTAMFSPHPRMWATAGSTNICAFSVLAATNAPAPQ